MGTRSNLKFESPPNPRGILALSSVYTLLTNLRVRSLIYILNKSKESINQLTNNDIHSNVPYSGTIVRRVPLLGICPELRNTMASTYQSKSVIIIKNRCD